MANHAGTRTAQLYDRRRDEVSLSEVEHIRLCAVPALSAYAYQNDVQLLPALMRGWKAEGRSLRAIARELNALSIRTPGGSQWYASTVCNMLRTTFAQRPQCKQH